MRTFLLYKLADRINLLHRKIDITVVIQTQTIVLSNELY
ncbi:hypothetical protein PUND_b0091 [Pseudoalteromonas undina]|nr:hypothetical protein PUND_b0091 [Pseudoalteromonas undina]